MKLYLDEDLSPQIAHILRTRGIDVVSAHDGPSALSDAEHLQLAAAAGRVLVTRNVRDFVVLTEEFLRQHQPHAGVIVCPPRFRGLEFSVIAEAIVATRDRYPTGLDPYAVIFLRSQSG